jgi:hypothetical protein
MEIFKIRDNYNTVLIIGKHNTKLVDELFPGRIYNTKLILTGYNEEIIHNFMTAHINSHRQMKYDDMPRSYIHIQAMNTQKIGTSMKTLRYLIINGRHFKIDLIIEMDYVPEIEIDMRVNIDIIALFNNEYRYNNIRYFNKYFNKYLLNHQLSLDQIDGCYIHDNGFHQHDTGFHQIGLYKYKPIQKEWNQDLHKYFNKPFKKRIAVFIYGYSNSNSLLSSLNKLIIYKIIEYAAADEY